MVYGTETSEHLQAGIYAYENVLSKGVLAWFPQSDALPTELPVPVFIGYYEFCMPTFLAKRHKTTENRGPVLSGNHAHFPPLSFQKSSSLRTPRL